jgi:hypothetical protein
MNAVDTNVYVYALDADEAAKQAKALGLFEQLAQKPADCPRPRSTHPIPLTVRVSHKCTRAASMVVPGQVQSMGEGIRCGGGCNDRGGRTGHRRAKAQGGSLAGHHVAR